MSPAPFHKITLTLPSWAKEFANRGKQPFGSTEERMEFVIALARQNVRRRTGGPFGAAVFEAASGRLVSVGVNRVEPTHCSIAHAEMMAIGLAQQTLRNFDLSRRGVAYELVTSTEPCAMCLGAIPWSGLKRVVCGARGKDACEIGFDEGAKPRNWIASLRQRQIEVVRDVLREEARIVLREYVESGGRLYNPAGRSLT
jgi:tRNA(Arg) A34 adenosine deaminase TadA